MHIYVVVFCSTFAIVILTDRDTQSEGVLNGVAKGSWHDQPFSSQRAKIGQMSDGLEQIVSAEHTSQWFRLPIEPYIG